MKDETNLPILIVDDNSQYAQLLRKILESSFGFNNITSVSDTKDAKDLIDSDPEKFRLLFIDYNFPTGYTGGELLGDLHKANQMHGKAAFLITSEPSLSNVDQATKAGALGVVVKPFSRTDLQTKIERALRFLDNENDTF